MAKLKEIIGEDLYKQLSADKQKECEGKDYEDVSGGAYIPKQRFDQINGDVKEYKKQVEERDTQIKNLKEEYKDVDGIKDKLSNLEENNKIQKEAYEKQLSDIGFTNALEKGLGAYSIKDKKLILALIDKDKLKVDGDNIIGLKEQMEPLQKSYDFLFEKEINGTQSFDTNGGGNPTPPEPKNFATELGKERAAAMQTKGIADFAK